MLPTNTTAPCAGSPWPVSDTVSPSGSLSLASTSTEPGTFSVVVMSSSTGVGLRLRWIAVPLTAAERASYLPVSEPWVRTTADRLHVPTHGGDQLFEPAW